MATETGWLVDDDAPGPRKPLYLRGGPGLRVEVDGPALRIRRPMQAALLFPLARVGRVISSGPVDWPCEALLACAGAGVPVVFLCRDGSVRGYLFGGDSRCRDPHDLLYTRLRARLTRPGGMQRYGEWREAMTRAAVRALSRQLGQQPEERDPTQMRQRLAEIRQRYAGPGPALLIEGRLRGLLAGLSAELLAEVGLDARRWPKLEFTFDLVGDLAELLRWAMETPVLAALARREEPDGLDLSTERDLIVVFERSVADLRRLGLDALHLLRQKLET